MSELAHTRALLAELLELDEEDAQLPLAILINLHRVQLREPLQRFAGWTVWTKQHDEAAKRLTVLLHEEYPSLTAGRIFQDSGALMAEIERQERENVEVLVRRLRKHLGEVSAPDHVKNIMDVLLKYADMDWTAFDPLVRLYAATFSLPGTPRDSQLQLLEIELGLDPAVSRMILDLGRGVVA